MHKGINDFTTYVVVDIRNNLW